MKIFYRRGNEAFHLKNLSEPQTQNDYDAMFRFYLRILSGIGVNSKEKRQLAEKYLAKADAVFEKSSQNEEMKTTLENFRIKLK